MVQWILDLVNLEKSSLNQISSLYREVSRFSEDFWPFFTKIHDHPSVEKDLSLKIEVRDQTIWTSTPEL